MLPDRHRVALSLTILLTFSVPCAAQSTAFCHPGVQQLMRGDIAGAIRNLDVRSTRGTGDAALIAASAVARLLDGDAAAADAILTRGLETHPDSTELYYNRGLARLSAGNLPSAAADLEMVVDKAAGSDLAARAAYHRALIFVHQGQWSSAEQWSRRALNIDPLLPDPRVLLGYALERQQRWADAGQEYKLFLADHPQATWAMVRFGVTALRAGFPDTARAWFKRAAEASNGTDAAEARKYLVMLE